MTAQLERNASAYRPRRGGRRTLGNAAWIALLILVVTGFGFMASRSAELPDQGPPRGDVAAAEHAVDALLAPGPDTKALERLPADFTAVTDVVPASERAPDGTVRAVHADGGCSTPWGDDDTKWHFGTACRAHDLGYDLLRYAEKKGHPLAPELRRGLDDRLTEDMRAMCRIDPNGEQRRCEATASLFSAGLTVNSWHQRWGPPVGEPIVPLLAGVAVIGFLLSFRLRGWLMTRRSAPRPKHVVERQVGGSAIRGRTLLGVGAIVALVLGESAVALARWAGASEDWLWPFTWLAQLSFLFFFAGGKANAAGWLTVLDSGGRYREYLAHRGGWLLRLGLVFALVAFATPTALELLGIPEATADAVVRMALHPLWLLGLYVLTIAATPVMYALHRRAPAVGVLGLLALLGVLAVTGVQEALPGSPLVGNVSGLVLALLAQQVAFVTSGPRAHTRATTVVVCLAGVVGAGSLAAGAVSGSMPLTLLGAPDAPPALAGPALPILALGAVQLSLLVALRRPLARLADMSAPRRAAAFASRAPMSLYLVFVAGVLLLVSLVYLPSALGSDSGWLPRPRQVLAVALLAAPAAAVFWWFERHLGHHPPTPFRVPGAVGRFDRIRAFAATVAGIGYATLGVFGLALTAFGGFAGELLPGLLHDPVQSLVHLSLGIALLHSVRTGATRTTGTWLLTALACVPPLLFATSGPTVDALGLVVHGATGLLALGLALATVWTARANAGYAT